MDFGDIWRAYQEYREEKRDDGKVSAAEWLEIVGHLAEGIAEDAGKYQEIVEGLGLAMLKVAELMGEEIE